jgi:hypothetical protein
MQERLKRVGHNASRAISGYMLGNILISVIASGVTYVGLWAFGVPFRGVAAVWVGFADLIPLVGATLGAVPTVGLSFLHSVAAGVGMIIVYVVYQQFENHVIQVAIMSRTVKLSPLGVLVSLLIGVQLFGLLGALLAIPAAGIIHVVGAELYRERQARRGGPADAETVGAETEETEAVQAEAVQAEAVQAEAAQAGTEETEPVQVYPVQAEGAGHTADGRGDGVTDAPANGDDVAVAGAAGNGDAARGADRPGEGGASHRAPGAALPAVAAAPARRR